jgi:CRP-like cAMP-binding protein
MTRQRSTSTHSSHPVTNSTSKALQRLTLFEACSSADLDALMGDVDLITVAAGTVIDRQGTTARQFIGIIEGYVRAADAEGTPFVLGPGDHIGAAELFADQPHAATFTTSTTATLAAVFGPKFRMVARSLPGVVDRAHAARRNRHIGTARAALV